MGWLGYRDRKEVTCTSCQTLHTSQHYTRGVIMTDKFKTQEQLDDYFGEDSIECLICHKHLKSLGVHLRMKHDMTAKGYRYQFGIPMKYGLVSKELSERMSKNSEANTKHLLKFTPEDRVKYGKIGAAAAKAADNTRGNHSDITNKMFKKRAEEVLTPLSKKKIDELRSDPDVDGKCEGCGDTTSVSAINKWREIKIFCECCKKKKHNIVQTKAREKWRKEDNEGRKKYFNEKGKIYRERDKKARIARGEHPKERGGESSPLSKLTDQEAVDIYVTYHNSDKHHGIVREMARQYEVSEGVIHSILKRRTYKKALSIHLGETS